MLCLFFSNGSAAVNNPTFAAEIEQEDGNTKRGNFCSPCPSSPPFVHANIFTLVPGLMLIPPKFRMGPLKESYFAREMVLTKFSQPARGKEAPTNANKFYREFLISKSRMTS